MSETTVEATETGADDTPQEQTNELPNDHPLVKSLAAQKAEIKELKAKAKRLDDLERAQMSEAEKAAERIAKAEAAAASVPAEVTKHLKAHLVTLDEIDSEDADLFLTATDPELLLKQHARLLDKLGKRKHKNHVPLEGKPPRNAEPTNDMREFTRNLFNPGNSD